MNHEKFLKNVEIVPESGCWLWMGWTFPSGYGRSYAKNGNRSYAHRVSYELFVGVIPEKKYVLHRCDVRCCVNPAHLYVGTQVDNMKDAVARNRMRSGDRHPSKLHPESIAKGETQWKHILTEEDVKFIRSSKLKQRELAIMFGVKQPTISNILTRTNWKHVT